jgi:hypothetical protein
MSPENAVVAQRSELLARVFLTRRLNINVHPFGDNNDEGLNFICTIRDDRVKGFLPFGVLVWGTAKELSTETEATAYGRQKKKVLRQSTFFFPVVVLLFSMQDDQGYFSWLVEPCQEGNKLFHVPELKFKTFDTKHLDRMIKRIASWYNRLSHDIVAEADEIDSGQCADEE